jgi:small conductance mechanosensitive channel
MHGELRLCLAESKKMRTCTLFHRIGLWLLLPGMLGGNLEAAPTVPATVNTTNPTAAEAPAKVDVTPVAKDDQIKNRLTKILLATGWFGKPNVDVREGVVVLEGQTSTKDHKDWAGALASKTEDVVAVLNRIEVVQGPLLDLTPAWA